jgi:hypothetical protein
VLTWGAFRRTRPDLADAGRDLLYQFGVGLAFLATVRPDGAPRVHPMCPVIVGDGLYGLLVPSPKRGDLLRDGRYALHAFPADENEDAFYLTGTAEPRPGSAIWDTVTAAFLAERGLAERPPSMGSQRLFEFSIGSCLLTRTDGHGDPAPKHTVWNGPSDP